MRKLKKGLSCLLMLNLLLGGGFVIAPKAEAQSLFAPSAVLIPFITTEAGKFTFISVLSDGNTGVPLLHITYATKSAALTGTVLNRTACDHFDGDITSTERDMMIFEANGKVKTDPPNAALFEGASPVTSIPLVYPNSGRIGFAIIENQANGINGTNLGGHVFADTTVIDAGSGLFLAESSAFSWSAIGADPDFTFIDGGPGVAANNIKILQFFPDAVANTSWYILPLGTRSTMATPGGGGIRRLLSTAPSLLGFGIGSVVDLDEDFFSGSQLVQIRCWGIVDRTNLLQPAAVTATANGGFLAVQSSPALTPSTLSLVDPTDPGGVYVGGANSIFKIERSNALGFPIQVIRQEPSHNGSFCPQDPAKGPGC